LTDQASKDTGCPGIEAFESYWEPYEELLAKLDQDAPDKAKKATNMTADQVKELLPFIEAFANKKPLQYRNKSLTGEWSTINPETTEFRFEHLTAHDGEWRIPESQDDNTST
jgi:hypothetical protein